MISTRFLVSTSLLLAALSVPSLAAGQATAVVCMDGTTSAVSGRGACTSHGGVNKEATKTEHKDLKRVEKSTRHVATCADGTTTDAVGRGACSGHGGVRSEVVTNNAHSDARSVADDRAAGTGGHEDKNPAGALARCKDGLYSHAAQRQGACSRHGGVAQWMSH